MQGRGWEYQLYFKLQIRRERKIHHRVWKNLQQQTQHFRLHIHIRWPVREREREVEIDSSELIHPKPKPPPCCRAERLDGGLRYLSDLQGLPGKKL